MRIQCARGMRCLHGGMDAAAPSARERTPWQVVVGIVVAALGVVAAFGLVGAAVGVSVVFAFGEPDEGAMLGLALLLVAGAALAAAAVVAAIRGRGWSRPALLVAAVIAAVAAVLVGQTWLGSVPIVLGAILLWLPASQRWFAARRALRAAAARPARG